MNEIKIYAAQPHSSIGAEKQVHLHGPKTPVFTHFTLPGGGMPSWHRKTEKNWKGNLDGYI